MVAACQKSVVDTLLLLALLCFAAQTSANLPIEFKYHTNAELFSLMDAYGAQYPSVSCFIQYCRLGCGLVSVCVCACV